MYFGQFIENITRDYIHLRYSNVSLRVNLFELGLIMILVSIFFQIYENEINLLMSRKSFKKSKEKNESFRCFN